MPEKAKEQKELLLPQCEGRIMSKSKILENTGSYHDKLIESLTNSKEASMYLRVAIEEYQNDHDTDALLVALRNVTEALESMSLSTRSSR